MPMSNALVAAIALAAMLTAAAPALACACCTNQGQRHVGVSKLEAGLREEIGRLRFLGEAELYTGEAEPADVKGIATPSAKYELHVAQEDSRWIFAFRDKAGRSGTLILAIPDTVAIFAVDPRNDEREGGTGPALYKEWKLTWAAAGTGIFAPGLGKGQRLTLVLHAHGNNCTSADMATHWTLMVHGPKAQYHLFGKIVQ
jgi:hypothetical protein